MKRFLFLAVICLAQVCALAPANASGGSFANCGSGWVLADNNKLEGINSQKCEKLWCRDLELNKLMGSGSSAASGYVATSQPVLMESADGKSIGCFGDRKWCAGEVAGRWNPEYGAYTRRGEDSASFVSIQKGDCFAWQTGNLGDVGCASGKIPILINGRWSCSSQKTGAATNISGKGKPRIIHRGGSSFRR